VENSDWIYYLHLMYSSYLSC